jgi:hypothetical protein
MPDATVDRDSVPSRHELESDISCKSECGSFCETLDDQSLKVQGLLDDLMHSRTIAHVLMLSAMHV